LLFIETPVGLAIELAGRGRQRIRDSALYRLTPDAGRQSVRGEDEKLVRGASPLRGRTGSPASQSSISSDRHLDFAPTTRLRGNVPARIQPHTVGKLTPTIARTSAFESNRTGGGALGAAALLATASSAVFAFLDTGCHPHSPHGKRAKARSRAGAWTRSFLKRLPGGLGD
jgi:hypothetical protein